MALAAERAKYGLPADFKVTREMKRDFTPQEKQMYKTAYEIGGAKRANEVMKSYFAKKKAAAAREAAEAAGTAAPGGSGTDKAAPTMANMAEVTRSSAPPAAKPKPPPSTESKVLTTIPRGETATPGTMLYAGTVDWDNLGKKTSEPGTALWTFCRVFPTNVQIRLVASGASACHAVCVDTAGALYAWGRNDAGQLGLGDVNARGAPCKVPGLDKHKIRHASCGRKHTLVCTEEGSMFSWGTHKAGQLGTGVKVNDGSTTPVKVALMSSGAPVTRVACGAEFCMAVNEDGLVAAWGHPMYGQLGNRSNGEFIEKAGAISYHFDVVPKVVRFDGECAKIVDVVCGNNHTVVLTEEGTVHSWGFGGYGRLGHNSQKDLMQPMEIDTFNVAKCRNPRMAATMIAAGATCSYALSQGGQVFFWGRTKSSGEATMYPKPVYDLNGWNVRAIACGANSSFVSADEAVISWGPSPTCGELGYGDPVSNPKSSTIPKLVDALQGVHCTQVAAGNGFSMVLIDSSEKSAAVLKDVPLYEPEQLVIPSTAAEPAKPPPKGKGKRAAEAAVVKGVAAAKAGAKKGKK